MRLSPVASLLRSHHPRKLRHARSLRRCSAPKQEMRSPNCPRGALQRSLADPNPATVQGKQPSVSARTQFQLLLHVEGTTAALLVQPMDLCAVNDPGRPAGARCL